MPCSFSPVAFQFFTTSFHSTLGTFVNTNPAAWMALPSLPDYSSDLSLRGTYLKIPSLMSKSSSFMLLGELPFNWEWLSCQQQEPEVEGFGPRRWISCLLCHGSWETRWVFGWLVWVKLPRTWLGSFLHLVFCIVNFILRRASSLVGVSPQQLWTSGGFWNLRRIREFLDQESSAFLSIYHVGPHWVLSSSISESVIDCGESQDCFRPHYLLNLWKQGWGTRPKVHGLWMLGNEHRSMGVHTNLR